MNLRIKNIGLVDYLATWETMREFTEARHPETTDEIWLVEHPPVFTLGRNGDPAHILNATGIPIVESDRGGQVTYHGPGQLVAYTLFDLNRLGIGIRSLVTGLENAIISTLSQYGIKAEARRDAPGVYVDGRKIASLGLRIRKGCSYHGLSLNVDMDLTPFTAINPCGYPGLEVTRLADLGVPVRTYEVAVPLVGAVMREFGYVEIHHGR
ncbi:MAG: lipoyl(octanoyl) transferase LipB [Proteobacteria bacterium]|nr:lipoyl(octanoyl) transferase LipB [Pseudomonadota bacterium]